MVKGLLLIGALLFLVAPLANAQSATTEVTIFDTPQPAQREVDGVRVNVIAKVRIDITGLDIPYKEIQLDRVGRKGVYWCSCIDFYNPRSPMSSGFTQDRALSMEYETYASPPVNNFIEFYIEEGFEWRRFRKNAEWINIKLRDGYEAPDGEDKIVVVAPRPVFRLPL